MSKEPHYAIAPFHLYLTPFSMNLMSDTAYHLNLKLQLSQGSTATLPYYKVTIVSINRPKVLYH